MNLPSLSNSTIAIIGLGYVGLPLSLEFARSSQNNTSSANTIRSVIGFDISNVRISELQDGYDRTCECTSSDLASVNNLTFTTDPEYLINADVFIVTVPTPIQISKIPDFSPLESASKTVGNALRQRSLDSKRDSAIVIYESTVYPGATRDICIPILESSSGLTCNKDFFCGYSPERVNPGDPLRKISSIVKVTSGSTPESAIWVDNLYKSIITAGTHLTSSIETAEAAKVIENTQRDLNIALINELALVFDKLDLDTHDVLDAAATKWNFLHFKPGLVGGHCIGVDPYYLTFCAQQAGYYPQVVLAGRRINDGMGQWIVERLILEFAKRSIPVGNASVLVLGLTFKENCPDLRNSRVVDIIQKLKDYNCNPTVVDPLADSTEAKMLYEVELRSEIPTEHKYQAIILAVAHDQFKLLTEVQIKNSLDDNGIIFDLKNCFSRSIADLRL